jgi:PAS domain S-box-containing protein
MAYTHNPAHPARSLLSVSDIVLDYGGLRALDGVDLNVREGEVHAIVGEHGAGKSSLARVLSGLVRPSEGRVGVEGRATPGFDFSQARRMGIQMVDQEIPLNPNFSAAENLFFADPELGRSSWRRRRRQEREAGRLFEKYGFDIRPSEYVQRLSLSDKAVVAILKHLYTPPRVLILDESLEKLAAHALRPILQTLKRLKKDGMGVVFITHRIDDIYDFADRVTILRSGRVQLSDEVSEIDKISLIRMTYTQVTATEETAHLPADFRRILKYNEAVLQYLPVNLIVIDSELNVQMVNEAGRGFFGIEDQSYRGIPLRELFEAGNSQALELIEAGIKQQAVSRYYQVQTVAHGETGASNIQTVPVLDNGKHIGSIIILEDVTEYDQLQKQLILSEKLASVGLLAAGVGHEINNPLEIISNYLTYINYTYAEPGLGDAINRVRDEIHSISNIVSNLVSFSDNRVDATDWVDLNDSVENLLGLVRHNAKYKHIEIDYRPRDGGVWFLGSRDEIKQVILNLLKNSFEAMPEGGRIRVSTGYEHKDGGRMCRIDFEDTGPGIEDKNPNNVFLPFYSTKNGTGSTTGLGLSVTYNIIERYHGSIFVENLPARGCRFTVLLPTRHGVDPEQ